MTISTPEIPVEVLHFADGEYSQAATAPFLSWVGSPEQLVLKFGQLEWSQSGAHPRRRLNGGLHGDSGLFL